jgi:NAD(P)-dependent dehydrogenase (short-subunit alcohol dehydrogenase family)
MQEILVSGGNSGIGLEATRRLREAAERVDALYGASQRSGPARPNRRFHLLGHGS